MQNKLQDERLSKLWKEMLSKLPAQVAKIILPGLTVVDKPKFPPQEQVICRWSKFSTDGVVALSVEALNECDEATVKGFMAHELAHSYRLRTCPASINELDDGKIDQIAKSWGFEDEIEAMRKVNPLK